MLRFSEIHDCKKCHGKIVLINADKLGNTYCGYCGERVDYKSYWKLKLPEMIEDLKKKGIKESDIKEFKNLFKNNLLPD
ncbi:MAG: hypothetical protein ABIA37_03050 [Candidatus Woesearchaeota archaeon]